jgi:hypothetical protein
LQEKNRLKDSKEISVSAQDIQFIHEMSCTMTGGANGRHFQSQPQQVWQDPYEKTMGRISDHATA